jgi:hypothetical protein
MLISLLLFLGLSAMGGGFFLIVSPSGKLLGGLPLSILEHSLFSDFLIPGIILFLILGFFPCLICLALIKKPTNRFAEYFNFFKDMHWAWSFCIYVALHSLSGYKWKQYLCKARVGCKPFTSYMQYRSFLSHCSHKSELFTKNKKQENNQTI